MRASILCPAVCINDNMNKAGMGRKRIKYVMSQPFSALHGWRVNQHGCTMRSSNLRRQNKYFFCTNIDRSICTNIDRSISWRSSNLQRQNKYFFLQILTDQSIEARGWKLEISAHFLQFFKPADAFSSVPLCFCSSLCPDYDSTHVILLNPHWKQQREVACTPLNTHTHTHTHTHTYTHTHTHTPSYFHDEAN